MKNVKKLSLIGAALFAIAAALTILLPALQYEDLQYTGYEIAFGKALLDVNPLDLGSIASAQLPVSYFAIAGYLFPLVAAVLFGVSEKLGVVSLVLLIASLILFVSLPNNVVIEYTIAGVENTADIDWSMDNGVIVAIIMLSMSTVLGILTIATND